MAVDYVCTREADREMEVRGQKEAVYAQQKETGYIIGGRSYLVGTLPQLNSGVVGGRPTERPEVSENIVTWTYNCVTDSRQSQ